MASIYDIYKDGHAGVVTQIPMLRWPCSWLSSRPIFYDHVEETSSTFVHVLFSLDAKWNIYKYKNIAPINLILNNGFEDSNPVYWIGKPNVTTEPW